MTQCTATTKAGRPCKAHAMHGRDHCSSHAGRARGGAPPGNTNALKHGFYRPTLTADEVTALITHADNLTLDDEIAVTRVMLRRLMSRLNDPDLSNEDLTSMAPLIFTGSKTVALLLRQKQPGSTMQDVMGDVLDALAAELNADL